VVQRHHAAVGLLQLAVEAGQVVALGPDLVQGRDQLLVLDGQLFEGGTRDVALQPGSYVVHAVGGQRRRAGGKAAGHPNDRTGTVIAHLHRVDQAADLFQLRSQPIGDARHRMLHLHSESRYPPTGYRERHFGIGSCGDHQPGHLAERGGQPGLVLFLQPHGPGDLAAELPDDEDVLLDPQTHPDQFFTGLVGHGRATRTPASSRRVPASRSTVAAMTCGDRESRPG
jgi:hypothetical protein